LRSLATVVAAFLVGCGLDPATVTVLGDSNTELSHFQFAKHLRWTEIVEARTGVDVENLGQDGASTRDFLPGGQYDDWQAGDVVIIAFGLNDEDMLSPEEFAADTEALVALVEIHGATPVLMTGVYLDWPDHYVGNVSDANDRWEPYWAVYTESDVNFIDAHSALKLAAGVGDWDIRIRNFASEGLGKYDPDVWDDSLDGEFGDGTRLWWKSVHYNARGSRYVAGLVEAEMLAIGCGI